MGNSEIPENFLFPSASGLAIKAKVGTIHLEQKESRVRVGIDMGEVGI